MQLQSITYGSLANLGNYENERVELTAKLEDGDNWEEVLERLKEMVHGQLAHYEDYQRNRHAIFKAQDDLKKIQAELEKARQNWEVTTNFMIAQGIKTDFDKFPELPALAPSKKSEEVIEGELEM